jgi:hypothetical protein
VTELAFPELARVLGPSGALAAIEPWRGPGYRLGTKVFGKREPVNCQPMTRARVAPLHEAFDRAEVIHHGALSRYAMIALWKLGVSVPVRAARRVTSIDDALASLVPALRQTGSSVAIIAARG